MASSELTKKQKIRFIVVMTIFAVGVITTYRENVLAVVLTPLTAYTAQLTLYLLHLFGMEATRAAASIYHPSGFAYEIYYRCLGFLFVIIFTAAVLSYPRSIRKKVYGIVLGVPVLLMLNFIRLVTLFYVGVHHPVAFDFVHTFFWNIILFIVTIGLWLGWLRSRW